MSRLDPQALFERYAAVFATRDPDAIVELHAADTQFRLHAGSAAVQGRQGVRDAFAGFFRDWPELGFEVVRLITGERHWVLDWVATATLTGADGERRPVRIDCLDVVTLDDGGLVHRKDTYVDLVQAQAALAGSVPAGA